MTPSKGPGSAPNDQRKAPLRRGVPFSERGAAPLGPEHVPRAGQGNNTPFCISLYIYIYILIYIYIHTNLCLHFLFDLSMQICMYEIVLHESLYDIL